MTGYEEAGETAAGAATLNASPVDELEVVTQLVRPRRRLIRDKEARKLVRSTHLECLSDCEDKYKQALALDTMRRFVADQKYGGQVLLGEFLNRGKTTISELLSGSKKMNNQVARDVLLVFEWEANSDERQWMYFLALAKTLDLVRKQLYPKDRPSVGLNKRRVAILTGMRADDWLLALYGGLEPSILLGLAAKHCEQHAHYTWFREEIGSPSQLVTMGYDWFDLYVDAQAVLNVGEVVRDR